MRTIKFRAWDGERKEMRVPDRIVNPQGYAVISIDGDSKQHTIYHTWPVMQYTGLKDKNGKEIYHLDILALPMRFYGDHTFKPSTAVMQWEHDGWYIEDQGECGYSEMEIIGNIYENPELIRS